MGLEGWLLVLQQGQAQAVRVANFETHGGHEVRGLADFGLDGARLDGAVLKDAWLHNSANVALRTLYDTLRGRPGWKPRRLELLIIETIRPPDQKRLNISGRSAELPVAMLTYLSELREALYTFGGDLDIEYPPFAATGELDDQGWVKSVEHVELKIAVVLPELPRGAQIFYPKGTAIPDKLVQQARDGDVRLVPVERLHEALHNLGVPVVYWDPQKSPYRALAPYRVADHSIYFGRDEEARSFCEALLRVESSGREPPRIGALILAVSGIGKSSFVQAGVLARLHWECDKQGRPLQYAVWHPSKALAEITSGDAVIDEAAIARSVARNWHEDEGFNATGFRGLPHALPETLAAMECAWRQTRNPAARYVWVIDQLEELFTLPFAKEAPVAFARFLKALQAQGVWIIATLRTEFITQYQDLRDASGVGVLVDVFQSLKYDLIALPHTALAQVISYPAHIAGLSFEQGLDSVLHTAAVKSGAIPVVGTTMHELWWHARRAADARDDSSGKAGLPDSGLRLTFESYQAVGGSENGGMEGVLDTVAEDTFQVLDEEAQKALPELLDALSTAQTIDGKKEDLARPVSLGRWPAESPCARLTLALIRSGLLQEQPKVNNQAALVKVGHEKLFTYWIRAAKYLRDTHDYRATVARFKTQQKRWDEAGRLDGALLASAQDLRDAEAIRDRLLLHASQKALPESEQSKVLEYIDQSREADRKRGEDERQKQQRQIAKDKRTKTVLAMLIASLNIAFAVALYSIFREEINARAKWIWSGLPMVGTHFAQYRLSSMRKLSHLTIFRECSSDDYCPEMVIMPAPTETFQLGYLGPDRRYFRPDQTTRSSHIRIDHAFAMSRTAVSENQWFNCVRAGICRLEPGDIQAPSDEPTRPMRGLSKTQADQYVDWLSRATGARYRLPSEVEYEYSARAGSKSIFPWGDEFDPSKVHCRYDVDCKANGLRDEPVAPLRFQANSWRLFDMNGNVLQWMADCYRPTLDALPSDGQPLHVDGCTTFAVRGGSFLTNVFGSTSTFRIDYTIGSKPRNLGLRVVRLENFRVLAAM